MANLTPHRRDVIKGALGAGAALCAPVGLSRAFAQTSGYRATALAGGLIAVSGPDGNVIVGDDGDGLVMVDGGARERAVELLDFVRGETGASTVRVLFNTHWHPAQTGANEALGAEGVKIVAHEHTRLWLSHEHWVRWEDKTYAPLPDAALPTETFYKTGSAPYGGGQIEYALMPRAHTDGDIYVHFPEADVIAAGGVGVADGWPVIDWSTGGWLGGYVDALAQLEGVVGDATKVVPAQGPVIDKAEIAAQREMYAEILTRMAVSLRASHGFDEMLAANPAEGFRPEWGDPEFFLRQCYRSIWGYIRGDRRVSTI